MSSVIGEIAQGAAGGLLGGIRDILKIFVADKSEGAAEKAALDLQALIGEQAAIQAQIEVDRVEAASPDRVNHWRGGLGWAIVAGIVWHYLALPILVYLGNVVMALGWVDPARVPKLPDLSAPDLSTLFDLALVMLGSHAVPHIRDAVTAFAPSK